MPSGDIACAATGRPGAARSRHQHLELVLRERRPELAPGSPGIVGVHLDPVGAATDLAAHDAGDRVVAVGLLGALRRIERVTSARRPVAPRGDDRAGDHDQAGTGHDPLLDRAPELDVVVERALGPKIALGGDARPECGLGVRHRARDAQSERLLEHLVVPQRLVVRVQEEVRVPFDEAGNQGGARERDPLGPCGDRDAGFGTCGFDPLAADENDPSLLRRVRRSVPHRAGHQQDRASGVGSTRSRLRRSVSDARKAP